MIYRSMLFLLLLVSIPFAQSSSSVSSSSSTFFPPSFWPADFWPQSFWPDDFWPKSSSSQNGNSNTSSGVSSSSSVMSLQEQCDAFLSESLIGINNVNNHGSRYINGKWARNNSNGNWEQSENYFIPIKNHTLIRKNGGCHDYDWWKSDIDKTHPITLDYGLLVQSRYGKNGDDFVRELRYTENRYRSWDQNRPGILLQGQYYYEGSRQINNVDVTNSQDYSDFQFKYILVWHEFRYTYTRLYMDNILYDFLGDENNNDYCLEVPANCNIEICDNNIDDNGDGKKDCDDPQCTNSPTCNPPDPYPEVCNDGLIDNDNNGVADCKDPACFSDPSCAGIKSCATQADCGDPACGFTDFCQPQNKCDASAPNCKDLACKDMPQCQETSVASSDEVSVYDTEDPDDGGPKSTCDDLKSGSGDAPCPLKSIAAFSDAEPVSVFDGSLYMTRNDIGLAQTDIFWVQPYYNSLWNHSSSLGHGWNSILDVRLIPKSNGGWVLRGDYGQKESFSAQGTNTTHKLTKYNMETILGGKRIRVARDRWYEFDSQGLLVRILDSQGNSATLSYAAQGGSSVLLDRLGVASNGFLQHGVAAVSTGYRLTSVTNDALSTDKLLFTYNTSGYLERIDGSSGRYVEYQYDTTGNLENVEKPITSTANLYTHYRFDVPTQHQMTRFTPTWVDCAICATSELWVGNQFDTKGRVATQVFLDRKYVFDYDAGKYSSKDPITKVTVVRLDALGNETTEKNTHFYTDKTVTNSGVTERVMASQLGNREPGIDGTLNQFITSSAFVFDPQNRLTREVDSRGRTVYYNRDTQGRITDKYTVAGSDTVQFLHKEYDAATSLESLRLEGGYKQNRDTIKTTYEYYTAAPNAGMLHSEKIWQNGTQYSETSYEYNAAGAVTKRTNLDGSIEEYTYSGSDQKNPATKSINGQVVETYINRDFAGRATKTQNALGQNATRTYDLLGRLLVSCDYEGVCTENTYQGRNLIATTRGKTATEAGITTQYVYNELGKVTHEYAVDANGIQKLIRQTTYDASENPVEIRDAVHQIDTVNESRVYSLEGGRILKSTDALGNAQYYQYNAASDLVAEKNPAAAVTRLEYDPAGHMTRREDALGNIEHWAYDSRGNVTWHQDALGHDSYTIYDQLNHPVMNIGWQQDTTYTQYNLNGQPTKKRSPEGVYDYYQYTDGRLTTIVHKVSDTLATPDSDDQLEQYSYDLYGHQTQVKTGTQGHMSTVSTRTYDGNGRVSTETDALGQTTTYHYYGHGGIQSVMLPTGDSTTYTYDYQGRKTKEYFNNTLQTQTEFDIAGRVSTRRTLGGDTLAYTYNANNQPQTITDGLNHATTYEYDAYRKPSKVTNAKGKITTTAHDILGRDSLTTDPMGNKTTTKYDPLGRPIVLDVNSNQQANYLYYDVGPSQLTVTVLFGAPAVLEWRNREGKVYERYQGLDTIRYTYDSRGRVNQKIAKDTTKSDTVTYRYNSQGQVDSIQSTNRVATSYQRDAVGRVTQSTQSVDGANYTTSYTYNDLARTTTMTLPSGTIVTKIQDPQGQLAVQLINADTVATYQWIGRQNSARTLGNGLTVTRTWDATGKESYLGYRKGTANQLSLTNTRDALGDLESATRSPWIDQNDQFSYRDDRQLQEHVTTDVTTQWNIPSGLGYIEGVTSTPTNGTPVTETRTTNPYSGATDILATPSDTTRVTYGNNAQVVKIDGKDYQWDAEMRLVKVGNFTYTYDAFGKLVKKSNVNGSFTSYIYDGQQIAEEIHSDGTSKTFVWGTYIDEPVAVRTKTLYGVTSTYYPLSGLNHNVEAISDDQGKVVERYAISAYGAFSIWGAGSDGIVGTSDDVHYAQSSVGNELVFQGRAFDMDANAYNFRARWYSPKLMKWMSLDPMLYKAGDENLTRGFSNDPINSVDPSGMSVVGDFMQEEISEYVCMLPGGCSNWPFVKRYLDGVGGQTSLQELGAFSFFLSTPAVKNALENVHQIVRNANVCKLGYTGNGYGMQESFNLEREFYVIGGATIFYQSKCDKQSCSIDYKFDDPFVDPTSLWEDLGTKITDQKTGNTFRQPESYPNDVPLANRWNDVWNPLGSPYQIKEFWSERITR